MNKYQQLPSAFQYFHLLDGRIPVRSKLKISSSPKNRYKGARKGANSFWIIGGITKTEGLVKLASISATKPSTDRYGA
jgi:hypothetical protein